jgi:hypothetical protein
MALGVLRKAALHSLVAKPAREIFQPLINLIHINVNDRIAAVQSGSKGAMTDASLNCLVSNNDVDHSSDVRWIAIVDVEFRLHPAISAAKMIEIAGH